MARTQTGELAVFLRDRAAQTELPGVRLPLLDEFAERARRLTDLGQVRLIACADPAPATLISHDRKLRSLCGLIGGGTRPCTSTGNQTSGGR